MPDREPKRPGLTKDAALVSDLLKLLLKIRAKETGVAARLIARSDDLEALAAGVRKNLKILSGWRFEQFGKDALDLVEGRLAFGIENGKLKMSRVAARGNGRCVRSRFWFALCCCSCACATAPGQDATGARPDARVTRATPAGDRRSSSVSPATARPAPRSCAPRMPRCFAGRRPA